jgi:hypothetical protein
MRAIETSVHDGILWFIAMTEKELEDTFKFGIEFSQRFYDAIIYLPVGRVAFQPAEHRTFTSPYMLNMMDDVLRGILIDISLHSS